MLNEYSVRLRTTNDYHFIVPVRAGNPQHAEKYARRFIADFYKVEVAECIVRHKGCALPTWAKKAQRVKPPQSEGAQTARFLAHRTANARAKTNKRRVA